MQRQAGGGAEREGGAEQAARGELPAGRVPWARVAGACRRGVLWACVVRVVECRGVSWACRGRVVDVSWTCRGVSWACRGRVVDVSWDECSGDEAMLHLLASASDELRAPSVEVIARSITCWVDFIANSQLSLPVSSCLPRV